MAVGDLPDDREPETRSVLGGRKARLEGVLGRGVVGQAGTVVLDEEPTAAREDVVGAILLEELR